MNPFRVTIGVLLAVIQGALWGIFVSPPECYLLSFLGGFIIGVVLKDWVFERV
jgi:hypothetical protein